MADMFDAIKALSDRAREEADAGSLNLYPLFAGSVPRADDLLDAHRMTAASDSPRPPLFRVWVRVSAAPSVPGFGRLWTKWACRGEGSDAQDEELVTIQIPGAGIPEDEVGRILQAKARGLKCSRVEDVGPRVPAARIVVSDSAGSASEAVALGSAAYLRPGWRGEVLAFWASIPTRDAEARSVPGIGLGHAGTSSRPVLVVVGHEEEPEEGEEARLPEELEERIRKDFDGFLLDAIRTVWPDHYGWEEVKTALLLTAVRAARRPGRRDAVHVLIVSDPGMGKTTLFRRFSELVGAPVLSGSQSTKAGLVATVQRSEHGWEVVAGELVLADWVAIIDEIDKMKDDLRMLHEAMEEQKVRISKGGVRGAEFEVRASIVAGGNPKHVVFQPGEEPFYQIGVPPSILDRFDSVFAISRALERELYGEGWEREKARKIVEAWAKPPRAPLTLEEVRAWLSAARELSPDWDPEALARAKDLVEELLEGPPELSGARQIQHLLRLSEAFAKARLSRRVEVEDVERALKLLRFSLMSLGFGGEIASPGKGGEALADRARMEAAKKLLSLLAPKCYTRQRLAEVAGQLLDVADLDRAGGPEAVAEALWEMAVSGEAEGAVVENRLFGAVLCKED